MNTCYMMIGVPGSGKSHYIDINLSDCIKISPDEIRKELYGDISEQGDPKEVFKIVDERLKVNSSHNVVYDATNTTKHRWKLIKKLRGMGFEKVVGIYMNTPFDVCMERNLLRDDRNEPVPEKIMLNMFVNMKNSEHDLFTDGFDEVRVINYRKE